MVTIPAPTHASEEWPDADYDLPEGADITPPPISDCDNDEDEDWDVEMDLGKTGGAKAVPFSQGSIRRSPLGKSGLVSIRPTLSSTAEAASPIECDEDEGISTIKISTLPATLANKQSESNASADDDDMDALDSDDDPISEGGFDTDDEDPDPELLITHQDTDPE